jgi:hypothetical protein
VGRGCYHHAPYTSSTDEGWERGEAERLSKRGREADGFFGSRPSSGQESSGLSMHAARASELDWREEYWKEKMTAAA